VYKNVIGIPATFETMMNYRTPFVVDLDEGREIITPIATCLLKNVLKGK
jgi:hypothetical protein